LVSSLFSAAPPRVSCLLRSPRSQASAALAGLRGDPGVVSSFLVAHIACVRARARYMGSFLLMSPPAPGGYVFVFGALYMGSFLLMVSARPRGMMSSFLGPISRVRVRVLGVGSLFWGLYRACA
jgi:hypothetical protein